MNPEMDYYYIHSVATNAAISVLKQAVANNNHVHVNISLFNLMVDSAVDGAIYHSVDKSVRIYPAQVLTVAEKVAIAAAKQYIATYSTTEHILQSYQEEGCVNGKTMGYTLDLNRERFEHLYES